MKLATTHPWFGYSVRLVPSLVDSCQPATSVAVTIVGISTTIFGMNLVVNSIRAGIESPPRIGPTMKPTNRSMIVQAAPNATCMNTSGHSVLTMTTTTSATKTTAAKTRPARGTMSKSGIAGGGPAWAAAGGGSEAGSRAMETI